MEDLTFWQQLGNWFSGNSDWLLPIITTVIGLIAGDQNGKRRTKKNLG